MRLLWYNRHVTEANLGDLEVNQKKQFKVHRKSDFHGKLHPNFFSLAGDSM